MQRFLAPTIFTLALFAVVLCEAQSVKLSLHDNWSFTVEGDEAWLGARVPGSVHMDLYRNNKIGDPFYRMNEKDLQWIERENWRYRTEFTVGENIAGKDRIDLVFEGLDTYATVTLNGVKVLEANNMFRGWRANVKEILRGGSNTLEIVFRSPIDEVMPRYEALG